MNMRRLIPFFSAALMVSWGTAAASDSPKRTAPSPREQPVARGTPPSPDASGETNTHVEPIPLRASGTVPVSEGGWFAWVHPARCDNSGNVFLVAVPQADLRDVKSASSPPRHTKNPSDIWGISASGKKRTLFSPSAVPGLGDVQEITTITTTVGPTGTLYAVVWVSRREDAGNQYIVSFDENGRYVSHVEVDGDEIVVKGLEVFGSGEFLVWGVRPWGGPRVAVMSGSGSGLQDVIIESEPGSKDSARLLALSDHVARGADGRIYFVTKGEEDIHGPESIQAISASAVAEPAFRLAPMPRTWRLMDLKAAGQRLAVMYLDEQGGGKSRAWIVVYDIRDGERLAVYGPTPGVPLCYEHTGDQDHFTVLNDANLVTLSPPS